MQDDFPVPNKLIKNPYGRLLVLMLGHLFFALGFIGVFLPLLPTTPFMILATVCYLRSSQRFYTWLAGHPRFGYYITAYLEGRGIPKRAKILGISMMWAGIIFSAFVLLNHIAAKICLPIIAIAVTIYMIYLPNLEEKKP